ncbi:MAG: hypothetical protein ACPGLY_27900 [Rubripirellula sp.]
MKFTIPYAKGSDTSREAAESMRGKTAALRNVILGFIRRTGGATCDEIEVALVLTHQTASARVTELHKKHMLIVDSGKRRKTRRNRNAVVWVAKDTRKPRSA